MITFHEIKRVIHKMAVLSGHIGQLRQLLPQVIQLSEQIDSLNEDLTLERDRMTAKIRSVEVLGEILKKHVYHDTGGQSEPELSSISNSHQQGASQNDRALDGQQAGLSDTPGPACDQFHAPTSPGLDRSSLML